ncbi:MAG: hypothetical protein ACFCVA_04565 [Gammaproteobacteria bacterium]
MPINRLHLPLAPLGDARQSPIYWICLVAARRPPWLSARSRYNISMPVLGLAPNAIAHGIGKTASKQVAGHTVGLEGTRGKV